MPRHFAFTAHGLLVLFGADFFGRKVSFTAILIMLHVAGLALAGWAVCAGVRRFGRDNDLVDQLLVTGVLIGLIIYVLGQRVSDINEHPRVRRGAPVQRGPGGQAARPAADPGPAGARARLVLACYLVSLGQAAARRRCRR